MTELVKTSSVSDAQKKMNPIMGVHQGMEVALSFVDQKAEKKHQSILGVTDVSCFTRFGIKGAQAAEWLMQQGIKTPEGINAWVEGTPGTLVLRLGNAEFLIEDQAKGKACSKLHAFNQSNMQGVSHVARADASFVLSGSKALNLLSELCVLDLRDAALPSNAVVMTQVAGISATLIRENLAGEKVYRIWCDGTYGAYMWEILIEIAQELGGGAVGLTCRFQ